VYGAVKDELAATLREIEEAGLYKRERQLTTPQAAHIGTTAGEALNFCANNYLGFADRQRSSRRARRRWMSGASGWRRCASSAEPRLSTTGSSRR
jgi:glycine C-acetyltransferase